MPAILSFAPMIISGKRRHIIHAFREAGATSSENARSLEDVGLSKSVLLEVQKLRGILVKAGQNRFYLDEVREKKVMRFRRILVFTLFVLAALIAWYFNKG